MAAAQPGYEYQAYEYGYDSTSAAAYPSYASYESNATYAAPVGYEGYGASGAYHTAPQAGQPYSTVDPYSGYPATAYAYSTAGAPAAPSQAAASQPAYTSSYNSSPSAAAYQYETRRSTPPPVPPAPVSSGPHYSGYEYSTSAPGTYSISNPQSATYSPYKTAPTANGTSSSIYANYPSAPAPSHAPYGVPPASHLQGGGAMGPPSASHGYGAPPPTGAPIAQRRPEYYQATSVAPQVHYVQPQPQAMPYRLPPRGGYQRELDEPGDENALLRHVVYITGLPKEIQNETLAEVFGAACGPIAPVDVRSPKPKIWVYKDRQTREGKGEATITFINPESAQVAISYFNGKELFGREIRVTLCPRRMYNMQKQNTPFNPGAAPSNTTTPISAMIKTNNNNGSVATTNTPSAPSNTSTTTTTPATPSANSITSSSTITTTVSSTPTTPVTPSNSVSAANPIATISSSTLGLPRQLNHSLFKIRQTPEQQRGLLPTPPISFGGPMMGVGMQRDGVRKELPRIALSRGNYANPAGVRPKPY